MSREARLEKNNRKAFPAQVSIPAVRNAQSPKRLFELLTLREIEQRFGLHFKLVYAMAEAGLLHAVQVGGKGRIYYPEWELRELLERSPSPVWAASAA